MLEQAAKATQTADLKDKRRIEQQLDEPDMATPPVVVTDGLELRGPGIVSVRPIIVKIGQLPTLLTAARPMDLCHRRNSLTPSKKRLQRGLINRAAVNSPA